MAETFDFGKGPVRCRRHNLGRGLVATTAQVGGSVSVGGDSAVGDEANIQGYVSLMGRTVVKDKAVIRGENIRLENCSLEENCFVGSSTNLSNVIVRGMASIEGINIGKHDQAPLVIDETPVIIRGIGRHPLVIVSSPFALLVIGGRTILQLRSFSRSTIGEDAIYVDSELARLCEISYAEAKILLEIVSKIIKFRLGWTPV